MARRQVEELQAALAEAEGREAAMLPNWLSYDNRQKTLKLRLKTPRTHRQESRPFEPTYRKNSRDAGTISNNS
jgi:hypothetical protein